MWQGLSRKTGMGGDIKVINPEIGENNRLLGIVSAALIFFGLLEVSALSVSLVGFAISRGAAIAILGGSFAASWWFYRGLNRGTGNLESNSFRPAWPGIVLAGLAICVYVMSWALAYALPDFSYDGLWYHIPAMHFWALAGRIHWIYADIPTGWDPLINNCLNGFPKGIELITFILIRATGFYRLLNSVNLVFIPIGALSISFLARILGANRNFALLAGVLFFFIPVNIAQSPTSYVDTATASVYSACFALLSAVLIKFRRGKLFWRGAVGLGAAVGLAMSAKIPGIIFLPLTVFLFFGAYFLERITKRLGSGIIFSNLLGFTTLVVVMAVMVGGYWSLRNYIFTRNPINPIGVSLAGHTVFPDLAWPGQFHSPYEEGTESWTQLRRVLGSWFSDLQEWWPRTTYGARHGGLGFLWIFGCVPALVFLLVSIFVGWMRKQPQNPMLRVRYPVILILLLLIAALLFFLMPPHHNHLARYTIWLYGIGLPGFALTAETAWSARRTLLRWGSRIWIIGTISFFVTEGLATFFYNVDRTSGYWEDWRSPPPIAFRLLRSLTESYPSGYPAGTLMNELLSGQGTAALGPLQDRRVLMLGRLAEGEAFGRRKIYFLDPRIAEAADELQHYLKKRGVRFVVWDADLEVPEALKKLALFREYAPGNFYVLAFNPYLLPESD